MARSRPCGRPAAASVRSDAEPAAVDGAGAVRRRAPRQRPLADRERGAGGVLPHAHRGRRPSAAVRRSGCSVPDGGFTRSPWPTARPATDRWTPLGTDDNAPYRVFHDVSAMPKGSLLEYRAVLKDSSGNHSVASTYATVGDPAPSGGGDVGGGGPVASPAPSRCRGSHNSEIGCAGRLGARLRPGPAAPSTRATRSGSRPCRCRPATTSTRLAIDKSWDENYGAGGVRAAATQSSRRRAGRRRRDVLLRLRRALRHHDAEGPIVTAAEDRSRASSAAPTTGRRRAWRPGSRTRTATAPSRTPPPPLPGAAAVTARRRPTA